ncbi:UDP-N-acetylmuramoylalanine--D-glutamate ligase [Candidatus Berkelbacteria bacterium RBG_13_40_8]|uniref:UDP-N-acetylmuramoylalanine--D-glutamate ligase n=1 Tax=Candidatus Berkelbacteria bacterium RBG_13_40_8 TaxID=1797467 RepID=A0A1F5DN34_9BACT|nr:MAG: UDP-N-acetylmuramoylalanine--D-glutamate ligase [Candidatus Berkelbacteria bacterium RBG_13_40_8]
MTDFQNKKVGILGLGEENIALAKFLVAKKANVVICDQKSREELGKYYEQAQTLPVQFRLGPHYLDHLEDFAVVFRTPGLPYLNEKIQAAKASGVKISSQIKLFFENSPSPIIGITGTKGKGTTASLIGEILKKANKSIYIAGNIGTPPISFLKELTPDDIVVLELSSFQLQDLNISPHIAVVLDIKVDHLDYHRDEAEYVDAKKNIVRYQKRSDLAVICADYLTSFEFAISTHGQVFWFSRRKSIDEGAFVRESSEIILRMYGKDYKIADSSEITLRGEHNLENICAAVTASYLAGADLESIKNAVKAFRGLEHRLEFIREVNGIKYYNDSFSTTPDTAIAAIRSFKEPIILIAGGSEKGADYSEFGKVISSSAVKTAILIGTTGPKIKLKIKDKKLKIIENCKNMDDIVEAVKNEAESGDVVLLSPASASFDWFQNYKDRGSQFKEAILRKFS